MLSGFELYPRWVPLTIKIGNCPVILGQLDFFQNYKGFSIIFLKYLDAIYYYYKSENFSNLFLHHIFESENLEFPFFYKKKFNLGSEMWKIELQKIVGNWLDELQKLYLNRIVIYKFFGILK